MGNLDFSVLLNSTDDIINGIMTTIVVSVLSAILAFVLGTVFVYFRTSTQKNVKKFTNLIVLFIRNTPLLILIYLFYKGFPSIKIVMSAFTCGVLALGIYTAAYISDALLSGINAVPREHFQATSALGFSRFQSFFYVVFPQALRYSIPILGSLFMNLIKNSSLVSFISVTDLFYVIYKGISDSYRIYEYFIFAVVIYCALTLFVLLLTNILQKIFKIPQAEVNV